MMPGMESLFVASPILFVVIVVVTGWTLLWKGWALWLAARRGEKLWFIPLLILNTLGILEIIYIFVVAKRKDVKEEKVDIIKNVDQK